MSALGSKKTQYSAAIHSAFDYLLETYPEVYVIGQGLWAPWYVGSTMTKLDEKYGCERIIDSPVSEAAVTGSAVGASLCGMKPIVVHPRIDFMLYAMDPIVNQASKWSYMFGGQSSPGLTIRGIINRGGEQGPQHSQSLHAWFAHVPGLRVVMPATAADARDLLISATLSPDPVLYIDDRWLYDVEEELPPITETELALVKPSVLHEGDAVTLVGSGYSTHLALLAAKQLKDSGVDCEVIDLRVLNPFDAQPVIKSVEKTGRLVVIDGGTRTAGFAAEVIAAVAERVSPRLIKSKPQRITLPDTPAPTSSAAERKYYPSIEAVVSKVQACIGKAAPLT